jgi:hypothetical protein
MTRSRRRWLIVAALLLTVAVIFLAMEEHSPDPPEVQKAAAIRIGMSGVDVFHIMGQPRRGYMGNQDRGYLFGEPTPSKSAVRWIKNSLWQRFGLRSAMSFDDYPVHIRFGANERVDRIKRGNEIITSQEAPQ